MTVQIYIPSSLHEAAHHLRTGWKHPLAELSRKEFIRVWSSVAYLFPGPHLDGFEDADSGWPAALKQFAVEAWRRAESGELTDEELYPSDAQWAGLYDRMVIHTPDETARRLELAWASRFRLDIPRSF